MNFLPLRIVRPRPPGWWLRFFLGGCSILWAVNTAQVGQQDLVAPEIYEAAFKYLDLLGWAVLGGILGLLQIVGSFCRLRWVDIVLAALLAGYWACFCFLIHWIDDDVLSLSFYIAIAIAEAATITIALITPSAYVR